VQQLKVSVSGAAGWRRSVDPERAPQLLDASGFALNKFWQSDLLSWRELSGLQKRFASLAYWNVTVA
jgi:hypothetical protein